VPDAPAHIAGFIEPYPQDRLTLAGPALPAVAWGDRP
jgi:hypothetical protein